MGEAVETIPSILNKCLLFSSKRPGTINDGI